MQRRVFLMRHVKCVEIYFYIHARVWWKKQQHDLETPAGRLELQKTHRDTNVHSTSFFSHSHVFFYDRRFEK